MNMFSTNSGYQMRTSDGGASNGAIATSLPPQSHHHHHHQTPSQNQHQQTPRIESPYYAGSPPSEDGSRRSTFQPQHHHHQTPHPSYTNHMMPVGMGFLGSAQQLRSHSWDGNSQQFLPSFPNSPYCMQTLPDYPRTPPPPATSTTTSSNGPYTPKHEHPHHPHHTHAPSLFMVNSMDYHIPSPHTPAAKGYHHALKGPGAGMGVSGYPIVTDRPHPCHFPGCGRMFKRLEHLKRHFRSIHTLDRPYPCRHPNCNKTFSRSDNLSQHMRVHRQTSAPSINLTMSQSLTTASAATGTTNSGDMALASKMPTFGRPARLSS